MKVLIKSTKNLSNYYVHAYETWKNSLKKLCEVQCYGEGYPNFAGWDISDEQIYQKIGWQPDVELWCGGPGNKKPQYISDQYILKNPIRSVPKLVLLTDFWEITRDLSISEWKKREEKLASYGVVGYFSFYSQAKNWMKEVVKSNFNTYVEFPYAFDSVFAEHNQSKRWNINLQLCLREYYPFRVAISKGIMQKSPKDGFTCFRDNGDAKHEYKDIPGDSDPLNKYFKGNNPVVNYARLLNSCDLTFADGYTKYCKERKQWNLPDEDLFLARYPQTLASSSVLFCPEITSSHIPKISDGIHYVSINGNNFYEKISFYLKNKDELDKIQKNANLWAEENCSPSAVAQSILKQLEGVA